MSPKKIYDIGYDRVEFIHEDQVIDPIVKANPITVELRSFSAKNAVLLCLDCSYRVVESDDGVWTHNDTGRNRHHNVERIVVSHE